MAKPYFKNKISRAQAVLILLFLGSAILTGALQYSTPSLRKEDKPYIVVTTNIIACPLQAIFKGEAVIDTIIPHDTDPHSYTPTLRDNTKLANADFICAMGFHFEGGLHTVVENIAMRYPEKTCILSNFLAPSEVKHEVENPEAANPHYYLDPTLFEKVVSQACRKFVRKHGLDSAYYEGRLAQYHEEIKEILQKGKAIIGQLPEAKRIVCMDHSTFEYAEKPFGFKTYALKGISMLGEHGLRDREKMTKLVLENQLSAIFCEVSKNKKSMQAIMDDCAHKKHDIVCKILNTDALQEGQTYKDLILDNLETIFNALK
ncbi:MAG: metal ABC transporter substrate-binding protein [Cytophagales bacterium]